MTSLPTIEPSYGTDLNVNWDVDRISFGDGYTARSNPGINPEQQVWRIVWEAIPAADAETLRLFFKGLKGTGIVDWQPFDQPTELKFTASKFASRPTGAGIATCSIVLTQEFDL